jgi:hypothetical protein
MFYDSCIAQKNMKTNEEQTKICFDFIAMPQESACKICNGYV